MTAKISMVTQDDTALALEQDPMSGFILSGLLVIFTAIAIVAAIIRRLRNKLPPPKALPKFKKPSFWQDLQDFCFEDDKKVN